MLKSTEKGISIIIPVLNDEKGIKDTLDSLTNQDECDVEYEVIVVDNGSDDHTKESVLEYRELFGDSLGLIEEKKRGSYRARNKGIREAKYSILCFLDSNVTVTEDFVKKVFQNMIDGKTDYLGCKVEMYTKRKTLCAKYNIKNDFPTKRNIEVQKYMPTLCLCVQRSLIDEVGEFDPRLTSNGDYEFGQRVHELGYKQEYCENIVVRHPARDRYVSLVKKGIRTGQGNAQMGFYYKKYREFRKMHFKMSRYRPADPRNIRRMYEEDNERLSYWEAVLLACYHIPIRIASLAGLIVESAHLMRGGDHGSA